MVKRVYRSKRFIDVIVAFGLIILISPIFVITTLLLAIANNGRIFFIQERPGKDGKIFKIIKFKTMNDKKDEKGELLEDDDRLTIVGQFVRKLSIDELPQLFNVIKGDMSLVGPRPLFTEYLPLYNKEQNRRHDVKPGITGWAQVNGRNAVAWQRRFELDVWYVDNISLVLDLKILFLTIVNVIKREGISEDGVATMTKFTGNK